MFVKLDEDGIVRSWGKYKMEGYQEVKGKLPEDFKKNPDYYTILSKEKAKGIKESQGKIMQRPDIMEYQEKKIAKEYEKRIAQEEIEKEEEKKFLKWEREQKELKEKEEVKDTIKEEPPKEEIKDPLKA